MIVSCIFLRSPGATFDVWEGEGRNKTSENDAEEERILMAARGRDHFHDLVTQALPLPDVREAGILGGGGPAFLTRSDPITRAAGSLCLHAC